jgi:hypothetical protein
MSWVISDDDKGFLEEAARVRSIELDLMVEVKESTVEEEYDIDGNPFDKKCWVAVPTEKPKKGES